MRKTFMAVVVLGLLSAVLLVPAPSGANVQGFASFNCNVTLPVWPTANGGPVHCLGNGKAVLQGKTTSGTAYRATTTNGKFDGAASFYNEKCTFNEALNGSAGGTTHISGLTSQLGSASAHTPFAWTRLGLTAVITLPPGGTVNFANGKVAKGTGTGRAVAVFRPTQPGVGGRTCTAPGQQKANIQGVALFLN